MSKSTKKTLATNPQTVRERLDRPGLLICLLLGQFLVIAPHLPRLPLWLSAVCLGAFIWRGYLYRYGRPLPARWLTASLALLTFAGVLWSFKTVAGREAGVALLVMASCLKLLELSLRRDALLLIFLGYFLVGTNLLFSQSIAMAAYLLLAVWVNTLSLVCLNRLDGCADARAATRGALRLVLQSLPYMLVLFVLFPRLPGPLWRMPDSPGRATTGMSDSMSFGDINALATDDNIAFRVRFEGEKPPRSTLYWRGLVFDRFDGISWRGSDVAALQPEPVVASGEPWRYTVALEQGRYRWLYGLDLPATRTDLAPLRGDHQLLLNRALNDRLSYRLSSHRDYRYGQSLAIADRQRFLQLPANDANTRARAFAQTQRRAEGSDAAYLDSLLRQIREQPFYYTLTPPILSEALIDDFWFNQRRGFCEHYAGSLVYLLRAGGVPARVVVGYQGGQSNPFGDYLIVRQLDAHAWTEVWLAGEGWRRVDPTAAIAPERVEALLNRRFSGVEPLFDAGMAFDGGDVTGWWGQAALYWDSVNSAWNSWVVDYNDERQHDLLGRLGLPDLGPRQLGYLLAGLLAAFVLIASYFVLRERQQADTIARLYARLERKLAKRGFERESHEAPLAFLQRVAGERLAYADELRAIAALYSALRYRNSQKPLLLQRELRRRIAAFKPRA